jgi:hypothetical protein
MLKSMKLIEQKAYVLRMAGLVSTDLPEVHAKIMIVCPAKDLPNI